VDHQDEARWWSDNFRWWNGRHRLWNAIPAELTTDIILIRMDKNFCA